MIERLFTLSPFPAPNLPAILLTGTVLLQQTHLALHYSLTGDTEEIMMPPASLHPSRKDELWKATCFEFFLAVKDQPGYWEFNMSPSGDWNVYRMDAYRKIGFRPETGFLQLPFEMKQGVNGYLLEVAADLTAILPPGEKLEMGITAILQTKDGHESYWALSHPGPQADFHVRESFILSLEAQAHPLRRTAPGG